MSDKLSCIFADLAKTFEEEHATLHAQQQHFEREKGAWELETAKMRRWTGPSAIKLNVGGQVFETTRETLCAVEDCFFSVMFSGRHPLVADSDGCYFIDRPPAVFKYILDFLRGEAVHVNELPRATLAELKHEAAFYCLDQLSTLIAAGERAFRHTCGTMIFAEGRVATAVDSAGAGRCTVLGPEVQAGSSSLTVKVGGRLGQRQVARAWVGLVADQFVQQPLWDRMPLEGWFVATEDGRAFVITHGDVRRFAGPTYERPLPNGGEITVSLNDQRAAPTVSFVFAGMAYKEAFVLPPSQRFWLLVWLHPGLTVELL